MDVGIVPPDTVRKSTGVACASAALILDPSEGGVTLHSSFVLDRMRVGTVIDLRST